MYTAELGNFPLNDEVLFFQNFMERIETLAYALASNFNEDVPEEVHCYYVPKSGKQRALPEFYLIASEWQPVRDYLMQKQPIHFFYEPEMRGLVNKPASIWVFSDIKHLRNFNHNEEIKLNQFSPKKCRPIPFQNIHDYFEERLIALLCDESMLYSMRAQECEKLLKLTTHYLSKPQAAAITHAARVLLKIGLYREIEDLIRIFKGKVLVEIPKLRKRTRAIYTLAMKYYFYNASDSVKQKIDALISPDGGSQLKALEYLERKVILSFNHWAPPKPQKIKTS